jgi:hypothetical protein
LLNFTNIMVFGVVGLWLAFEAAPAHRARPEPSIRYEAYTASPGASDLDVAANLQERLRIPLTGPVPKFALQRDAEHNLTFTLYSPNGQSKVTVLERESRVRIEARRNGFTQFLNALHAATYRQSRSALASRLWAVYNELSIFTLLFLTVTGPYLWLASRPRLRLAQISLGAGAAAFLALYAFTR